MKSAAPDPRYEKLRRALLPHLEARGWEFLSELGSARDFGSACSVYLQGQRRLRLVWDGRDAVFIVQHSDVPEGDDWQQVGPALSLDDGSCELPRQWLLAIGDAGLSPATVRAANASDAAAMARIYNHYITGTVVTFEEEPVDGEEMARRLRGVEDSGLPWLVAEESSGGEEKAGLLGYAYATKWAERVGYRFSSEVTVYLDASAVGRGVGKTLYSELLTELRRRGQRCAVGGIALPNAASVALHEKLGFEKVAHFARIGVKFDQWIDVGYWQLML